MLSLETEEEVKGVGTNGKAAASASPVHCNPHGVLGGASPTASAVALAGALVEDGNTNSLSKVGRAVGGGGSFYPSPESKE
jgi:hypothetical protein